VAKRLFGVSTYLYHAQRLSREHLLEIAAHGFEAFELFATRTHFDYHNPSAVADLQQWAAEAGLVLHSMHAPIAEGFAAGRWGSALSLASSDNEARTRAVNEAEQALYVARRMPIAAMVAHLGLPRTQPRDESEVGSADTRAAARRSIEELQRVAAPLGVHLALEVIPNELSRAGSLTHFVETDLEGSNVGICLDFGHAHLDGDVVDAIETVSEHLIATHVHDNEGRNDNHLLPFDGTIDWGGALTAIQKVGYDGPLMLEIAAQGPTKETLKKLQAVRQKMERLIE
jgi:sugar phosphate isomerase/epimerase